MIGCDLGLGAMDGQQRTADTAVDSVVLHLSTVASRVGLQSIKVKPLEALIQVVTHAAHRDLKWFAQDAFFTQWQRLGRVLARDQDTTIVGEVVQELAAIACWVYSKPFPTPKRLVNRVVEALGLPPFAKKEQVAAFVGSLAVLVVGGWRDREKVAAFVLEALRLLQQDNTSAEIGEMAKVVTLTIHDLLMCSLPQHCSTSTTTHQAGQFSNVASISGDESSANGVSGSVGAEAATAMNTPLHRLRETQGILREVMNLALKSLPPGPQVEVVRAVVLVMVDIAADPAADMLEKMPELGAAVGIPPDVFTGLLALTQGQLTMVAPLARRLGHFTDTQLALLKNILQVLTTSHASGASLPREILDGLGAGSKREVAARVFKLMDADGSGLLSYGPFELRPVGTAGNTMLTCALLTDEFREALKYFNVNISEHKALELFSRVGTHCTRGRSSHTAAPDIDEEQFRQAMALLQKDMALHSMYLLGMSRTTLYLYAAFLSFILIVVVAFIFVGVAACTFEAAAVCQADDC